MKDLYYLKFKDIIYTIRQETPQILSQSNVTYRNGSKIMEIFGFIIKQNNRDNTLSKDEAKKLGMKSGPSYWAQIERFITGFNLGHYHIGKTTKFKLNEKGLKLKNEISKKYNAETLIDWKERKNSRDLPEFVKKHYQSCLPIKNYDNLNQITKTIFCALLAAHEKSLSLINENKKPNKSQYALARKYFDYPDRTTDIKWIGWIGKILEDLGLVELSVDRKYFSITKHGSDTIENIVKNWKGRWNENFIETHELSDTYQISEFDDYKEEIISKKKNRKSIKPKKTEQLRLVTSRVGQSWFREELLERWNGRCSATDCSMFRVLIASHIVPWRSSLKDRLNVGNGLLLTPNLDALFDKQLISFDQNGKIVISSRLTKTQLLKLGINKKIKLKKVYDDMKPFLETHLSKLIR